MFKNFLIIGSKADPASRNIIMNLMDLGNFKYHIIDGDMLKTENLNFERINQFDFVIFASRHKSEKREKTLSIHAPGNWKEVWGGGEPGKICKSSALFQKHLFSILNQEKENANLKNYSVTMEVTHHGPLIEKPCVFIEVGGSEEEWRDKRASFVIAKTIRRAIETWRENPYHEIAVGIGGPHYCPNFNKIQLKSNVAISHIIPQYVQPITEEMILESISKTLEEVDFVVLDWKGLGKAENRQKVIDILEKNYISWKKSGDIPKG
jgi:D-aminoacyl-tRNA deacylase